MKNGHTQHLFHMLCHERNWCACNYHIDLHFLRKCIQGLINLAAELHLEQGRNSNSQLSNAFFAHRKTPGSASTHSCEWFKDDLEVLWIQFVQILHLKLGCSNFIPVRDSAVYPTCCCGPDICESEYTAAGSRFIEYLGICLSAAYSDKNQKVFQCFVD